MQVKTHDKLGMQVASLNSLIPYEMKEFTLDLVKNMNPNDSHNKRNRGKVVVELTFEPFREELERFSGALDCEGKVRSLGRASSQSSSGGGLLSVTVESAEDVEGRHHSNPYAVVLFRGERKKTKVKLVNFFCV